MWTGEVWQGGLMVAKVTGSQDQVMVEVVHYCAMYGQDGDVDAKVYPGRVAPKTKGVVFAYKAPRGGRA